MLRVDLPHQPAAALATALANSTAQPRRICHLPASVRTCSARLSPALLPREGGSEPRRGSATDTTTLQYSAMYCLSRGVLRAPAAAPQHSPSRGEWRLPGLRSRRPWDPAVNFKLSSTEQRACLPWGECAASSRRPRPCRTLYPAASRSSRQLSTTATYKPTATRRVVYCRLPLQALLDRAAVTRVPFIYCGYVSIYISV